MRLSRALVVLAGFVLTLALPGSVVASSRDQPSPVAAPGGPRLGVARVGGRATALARMPVGLQAAASAAIGGDPYIQQGGKLTGGAQFGTSVAVSGDGTTAIVGAYADNGNVGAAWVFIRSGSSWIQHAKLTASDEVGAGMFGMSVAISESGYWALVGGPADNGSVGAAWVFHRAGVSWTQMAKLTGSDEVGTGWFGRSVALSADGYNALVGGDYDNGGVGAAWVFTQYSDLHWEQQQPKLTGSGEVGAGHFGWSVAMSADRYTALVGGPNDGGDAGAAWVFTRSSLDFSPQGSKLTGSGEAGQGYFGTSVALSADGDTALVGGDSDNGGKGAAWVFTRSGTSWTQQGSKLTGIGQLGFAGSGFGKSVALSWDGNTALVGGPSDNYFYGSAWVFTRSGSSWTQLQKLAPSGVAGGSCLFGWSVSLASDGYTALFGGPNDNYLAGAAWVFVSSLGSSPPGPPPDKQTCKNGGWQYYTRADGSPFKNQGDCIGYALTGK